MKYLILSGKLSCFGGERSSLPNNIINDDDDCGAGKFTIRPKLCLGPGPVPRMSCAEDERSVAGVPRGAAEDYPVLGTPRLQ